MIIEQLIFIIISFAIFVYMFFRMIKNNDTSYVFLLVLEAIGIALNFLEVLFTIKLNILFVILKYIFAIVLPILVIILEKRNITLFEIIQTQKAKFYNFIGNNKKAKRALLSLIEKNPKSYNGHKMLAEVYEKERWNEKSY